MVVVWSCPYAVKVIAMTNPEREHRLREEARAAAAAGGFIERRKLPREEELTVAQAVAESGFSEDTIRRHITKGSLPVVRRGPTQRIRILRSAFERYLLNPN
jgi:hypothetical protein